jgi:hypothetical protein
MEQFPESIRAALSNVLSVLVLVLVPKQEVLLKRHVTIRNAVTRTLRGNYWQ